MNLQHSLIYSSINSDRSIAEPLCSFAIALITGGRCDRPVGRLVRKAVIGVGAWVRC